MNAQVSAQFRASIAELQGKIEKKQETIEWFVEYVKKIRGLVRSFEDLEVRAPWQDERIVGWKFGIELHNSKTLPELRAELIQLQMAVERATSHFSDACAFPEEAWDLLAEVAL